MIYRKFIIQNYKAIKRIEININKDIIPLIGINESGKTTVLHAILAFDKNKDTLMQGLHIEIANRYVHKQEECILAAEILFKDKQEFEAMGKSLSLNMDSNLYQWLKEKYEKKERILLRRNFSDGKLEKEYSLYEEVPEITNIKARAKLVKEIVRRLPNILYFDDFSDRVPDVVEIPDKYIAEHKFPNTKKREWQEILKEVFTRAITDELSLLTFLGLDNANKRADYLSDVNDKLNAEIITEWERLKQMCPELENEPSAIKLELEYEEYNKRFHFNIKDRETDNSRTFGVHERSKGFQWFFNFNMKLKYNSKYKEYPEDAIYLLDEPGSYLHSTAQTGLLKKLKEISEKNTIIFCTHSQYLLEPTEINIGSVKIVSKDEGSITLTDFGSSTVNKNLGAETPISHALQLKYGFNKHFKNSVLTEGINDFYFYKMFLNLSNVEIIPGQGCTNLKDLISILIAFCDRYLIILDKDKEGNKAKLTYTKYFKESFENNCYQYEYGHDKFVLEDLLSVKDCNAIRELTKCNDIKSALSVLYFGSNENIRIIKKGFDNETKDNTAKLEATIKEHFKD